MLKYKIPLPIEYTPNSDGIINQCSGCGRQIHEFMVKKNDDFVSPCCGSPCQYRHPENEIDAEAERIKLETRHNTTAKSKKIFANEGQFLMLEGFDIAGRDAELLSSEGFPENIKEAFPLAVSAVYCEDFEDGMEVYCLFGQDGKYIEKVVLNWGEIE